MIVELPIRIVSEANLREHWSKKSSRHKKQGLIIRNALHSHRIALPCVVTLTRVAPRQLDEDNLMTALKYARDTVADIIIPGLAKGRADGDSRIEWRYGQEKGKPKYYALKIEVIDGN